MGYGSRALNLLGEYYEGHIPSLSEGQLHVNPITSIDPDQVQWLSFPNTFIPNAHLYSKCQKWLNVKYIFLTYHLTSLVSVLIDLAIEIIY